MNHQEHIAELARAYLAGYTPRFLELSGSLIEYLRDGGDWSTVVDLQERYDAPVFVNPYRFGDATMAVVTSLPVVALWIRGDMRPEPNDVLRRMYGAFNGRVYLDIDYFHGSRIRLDHLEGASIERVRLRFGDIENLHLDPRLIADSARLTVRSCDGLNGSAFAEELAPAFTSFVFDSCESLDDLDLVAALRGVASGHSLTVRELNNPLRADHDVLEVFSRFDVLRIGDVDLHVPSDVAAKAHVEVLQVFDEEDLDVLKRIVAADRIEVVPHFFS